MRTVTAHKRKRQSLYVKRRNRTLKPALLSAGAFLLLVTFFLVRGLISPIASALSSNASDLKNTDVYSVLLAEKGDDEMITSLKLLIIQKKDKQLFAFAISPTQAIDMPGKLGEEQIGKAVQIGKALLYDTNESQLLSDAVRKLTAYTIDRYIIAPTDTYGIIDQSVFGGGIKMLLPWNFSAFGRGVGTNMSSGEVIDFFLFTNGLEPGDTELYEFAEVADMNAKFRDIALNSDVSAEALDVVVLNGTGSSDLAKIISDMCQNAGMKVILIGNTVNLYERSLIITDNFATPTVKKLLASFPSARLVSRSEALGLDEDLVDRGDVIVVSGFDILPLVQ